MIVDVLAQNYFYDIINGPQLEKLNNKQKG